MSSYLERVKHLEQQHEAVPATKAEHRVVSECGYELNESNEISPAITRCRVCTCDGYVPHPLSSCPDCQGLACTSCENCLSASLVWRRAQIDAHYKDVPLDELLVRLQKGSQWLQKQDRLYFDGDDGKAADDYLFTQMWALWNDLELTVRHVHNYQGCIFGDGLSCPIDGPVVCEACFTESTANRSDLK